jgi:hypothetical protein
LVYSQKNSHLGSELRIKQLVKTLATKLFIFDTTNVRPRTTFDWIIRENNGDISVKGYYRVAYSSPRVNDPEEVVQETERQVDSLF